VADFRIDLTTDIQRSSPLARRFLESDEAVYNLQLGILDRAEADEQLAQDCCLALVYEGEQLIGVALHTPLRPLLLSRMPTTAVSELVRALSGQREVSGVHGPREVVQAFAERWSARHGLRAKHRNSMGIFSLHQVLPPKPVEGQLRQATQNDLELLIGLEGEFWDEVPVEPPVNGVEASVRRHIDAGLTHLWTLDSGEVVSMAAVVRQTPQGAAISLVYTPKRYRGRGYASNCTAALCQHLLGSGKSFCFLFADLQNPTSVHVYEAIGFKRIAEVAEVAFGPAVTG